MKLHPESGQIKVMVADWDIDKMLNVQYHFAIQGTFEYLNKILDVPLTELNCYSVEDFCSELYSYTEDKFGIEEYDTIHEIVQELYMDQLNEWNDQIIDANHVQNLKEHFSKADPNWDMAGSGYLI